MSILDEFDTGFRRVRGKRGRKLATHCKNGHPFTAENTITEKSATTLSGTAKKCRICTRVRKLAQYHKSKGNRDG